MDLWVAGTRQAIFPVDKMSFPPKKNAFFYTKTTSLPMRSVTLRFGRPLSVSA